ncbi:hypothetical protein N7510_008475 [Penicillium lagena]|uniref:uncharacterized protein n=1 Tax=Penicillium lagena TaxID=94218 RepID=UPI002540C07B|nr:uncharacterized protein N7510_008475 [Penicillium lagena]KAJ5605694.1 hypothetical protein N7510_008475 [Penicillium lagena]
MSSEQYPVHHHGIYHNLPTFPPSTKNLTAIITGANGISGFATLRALLDHPDRWSKIYTISRSPPPAEMLNLLTPSQQSRIQHVSADFLQSPQTIAESLKASGVTADYIFFYSYLQPRPPAGAAPWTNAQELVRVNTALLTNFLSALSLCKIKPHRIALQTGAKNYGVHLGRIRTPAIESDPRVTLEPNFYYPQEDALWDWCAHNNVEWNVIRPSWIIGAVKAAQMNALYPFAVYAAVAAHRGQPLVFPADWSAWLMESHHATARLTGYLTEWAVLEEKCRNEAFNAQDTSPLSFDRLWEELIRWFGVEKGGVGPKEDESEMNAVVGKGGSNNPAGGGPPVTLKFSFTLQHWASQPENAAAWREIMAANPSVTVDPFQDVEGYFTFGDAAFGGIGQLSMNKARRLGWTGFVDTRESIFEMYHEMEGLGMLPRTKVDVARPLV